MPQLLLYVLCAAAPIIVKAVVDLVDKQVKLPKAAKAPLAVAVGVGAGALAHAAGASVEDARMVAEAAGGGALVTHAVVEGYKAVKGRGGKGKGQGKPPDASVLPPNPYAP